MQNINIKETEKESISWLVEKILKYTEQMLQQTGHISVGNIRKSLEEREQPDDPRLLTWRKRPGKVSGF